MTQNVYEMNPVHSITAGAVGEPGQREFYIQARTLNEVITVGAEKEQVQVLAHGVHELLSELDQKYPAKTQNRPLDPRDLELRIPFDPLFRAGKLELGYDEGRDLILLAVHELVPEGDEEEEAPQVPEEGSVAQLWATRAQMRAMADHALDVAARGRPTCVLCGQPYGPEGHLCPKKNGHAPLPESL